MYKRSLKQRSGSDLRNLSIVFFPKSTFLIKTSAFILLLFRSIKCSHLYIGLLLIKCFVMTLSLFHLI
jgi:hypothetical protein